MTLEINFKNYGTCVFFYGYRTIIKNKSLNCQIIAENHFFVLILYTSIPLLVIYDTSLTYVCSKEI